MRVTAAGESVTFTALAAPPPPSEWAGVIEFRPTARLDGDTLLASVWLLNRWPGTLRLKTMSGCFFRSPYPALFDATGAAVAQSFFGCTMAVRTRSIAPADSLYAGWALNVAGVSDGEYTLRFRFAVVEINDVPGTLPDVETRVSVTR